MSSTINLIAFGQVAMKLENFIKSRIYQKTKSSQGLCKAYIQLP